MGTTSPESPARPRPAPASHGFSLVELLVVVAVLGVVAVLSTASLGPLQAHFRGRDAATRVAAAATRARVGAWQTGRCHVLTVYDGATPAAVGAPGDRLRLQRYATADCETSTATAGLEDVESVLMPERVTVSQVAGTAPVWRSQGRLRGAQVELRVESGGRQRSIVLAPVGAVCTGDVPAGDCP